MPKTAVGNRDAGNVWPCVGEYFLLPLIKPSLLYFLFVSTSIRSHSKEYILTCPICPCAISDTPPELFTMVISDEKIAVEKTASPGDLSTDSLSSSGNRRNTDTNVDEKPNPIEEQITSQPTETDAEATKPQGPGTDSSEDKYKPQSLKFWLIILSSFVSMFLVALDRTIISTAIPTITNDFHSLTDIGWYGSAYMLTTAAFQLVWGRIYRFYDLRWTFLCCIVVFEIGSAICGSAPSSPVFIVGKFAMARRRK